MIRATELMKIYNLGKHLFIALSALQGNVKRTNQGIL